MSRRKRMWHVGMAMVTFAVAMGALIPFLWWSAKATFLTLIWGGVVLSAIAGVIYNPRMVLFREDDPKAFWQTWMLLTILSAVGSYFVLQLPF